MSNEDWLDDLVGEYYVVDEGFIEEWAEANDYDATEAFILSFNDLVGSVFEEACIAAERAGRRQLLPEDLPEIFFGHAEEE